MFNSTCSILEENGFISSYWPIPFLSKSTKSIFPLRWFCLIEPCFLLVRTGHWRAHLCGGPTTHLRGSLARDAFGESGVLSGPSGAHWAGITLLPAGAPRGAVLEPALHLGPHALAAGRTEDTPLQATLRSLLSLWPESSHRQRDGVAVRHWNAVDTDIWISDTSHISQNSTLLVFFFWVI